MDKSIIDYLNNRAAQYGGTAADILDKTPSCLWDNPDEIRAFWEANDLSHIFPQSKYQELSDDWENIVPEESEVNKARGAETMTHQEIVDAEASVQATAEIIDNSHFGDDSEFAEQLIDIVLGG